MPVGNESKPCPGAQVHLRAPWSHDMPVWFTRVEEQTSMKDEVAIALPSGLPVKMSRDTPTAYDDVNCAILGQSATSSGEKYTAIQHLDLGDTKPRQISVNGDRQVCSGLGRCGVCEVYIFSQTAV